jgi:hypothetical protein
MCGSVTVFSPPQLLVLCSRESGPGSLCPLLTPGIRQTELRKLPFVDPSQGWRPSQSVKCTYGKLGSRVDVLGLFKMPFEGKPSVTPGKVVTPTHAQRKMAVQGGAPPLLPSAPVALFPRFSVALDPSGCAVVSYPTLMKEWRKTRKVGTM